jgi:hypothetical protein
VLVVSVSHASEKTVVSLKGFCDNELKSAGIEIGRETTFHIKGLGAGGDYGWTYKSDELFAYGWIINADTRQLVWKMDIDNTSSSHGNREFDDNVTLKPGSYEVYFTVPTFSYHTTFTHININIDHREKNLFDSHDGANIFGFFKDWWSDDVKKDWQDRCGKWGMELLVEDSRALGIEKFTPPRALPDIVLKETGLGENEFIKQGFSVTEPTTVKIYALGEATGEYGLVDYAWIVNAANRSRVWEMSYRGCSKAGGAEKNIECTDDVALPEGRYVLYCATDDSHSALDWNAAPPYDPLNWGTTIYVANERDRKNIVPYQYKEDQNVIVAITKVKNDEHHTEGFTLKEDTKVRIYAFGERGNSRRSMADFAVIVNAETRQKVWALDVDRSAYAGGASKNRYVDQVMTLPKGSYEVTYTTDDSHAYGDWNANPPFDQEHYGITIMGVGEHFSEATVSKYVEQRDKNIVAQIIRVGDNADEERRFTLDKTTRLRVYAIGEGEKRGREMYDYGWIENARTGLTVWEMTYSMTFHAGGGTKNRMVNTAIVLDKGEYLLRYRSDDSHSYGDWNVDPPEDQEYWGITLFKDDMPDRDIPSPLPPLPPKKP